MNLTEEPEIVNWPPTHYVFVEKTGPLPKIAPEAWGTAHSLLPLIKEQQPVTGYMSLYKMNPNVYRACFAVDAEPNQLPAEFEYEEFPGGKYSKFVLNGAFSDLPAASRRVFEIVSKNDVMLRPGYCIENYVTDPNFTPPDQQIIEILIPTA
jgi:predicted transcriptional regulator YdeE